MIIIPSRQSKALAQNNRSKVLGFMWSSFNLDLQNDIATVRVSPRLRINTSAVSNQGRMVAGRVFDGRIFSICGTRIFKNSAETLISTFSEDASAGVQTNYVAAESDMEIFNSYLVTTTDTAIYTKAANGSGTGAWSLQGGYSSGSGPITLTTGVPHKLCYFQKFDRIYILDGSVIRSIGTASWAVTTSGDYNLSLSGTYGSPHVIAADSNDIWIGIVNQLGQNVMPIIGGAKILRWDGISSAVTEYKIKAQGVLALCRDDSTGIMHAIDSNGALLRFTGNGFKEIDRLPLDKKLLKNAVSLTYVNFIHPNGFTYTKNGTFKVLVNNLVGDSGATIQENFPSGVWEWSAEKGFVHANSASLLTLASSSITDHGQNRVSAVGALYEPNLYSESASGKPTLLCGIDYYSDASTAVSGIFVDDPLNSIEKYGYIVSPWILSQDLKDSWQKIALKYRQLLASTDKIIAKYRVREADPTEISITWVNTTSFTTSTDVSAMTGYEVEILQGTGGGKCSHISSVSGTGPYTVNLDETYTGVTTGTAKARVQNWKRICAVSDQTTEDYMSSVDAQSMRIQFKICMQFTGDDEIYEVGIINETKESMK